MNRTKFITRSSLTQAASTPRTSLTGRSSGRLPLALGLHMHIARPIALHSSKIEPKVGRPVGAFKTDVVALEARLDIQLPEAYREYLLWMGADFRGVLQGSDCFINQVEANAEGLADLLEENELPKLPYKPIVFFLHQGYIACWFKASDQSADPEVFSFNESDKASGIRSLGPFSEWLYNELLSLSGALK